MIYKLSDRQKILLKYAGILLLLISFVALTNYVTANLRESKDELFEKLNNFNQSKQLLAQIKVIKTVNQKKTKTLKKLRKLVEEKDQNQHVMVIGKKTAAV